jgi:hypothetical protein
MLDIFHRRILAYQANMGEIVSKDQLELLKQLLRSQIRSVFFLMRTKPVVPCFTIAKANRKRQNAAIGTYTLAAMTETYNHDHTVNTLLDPKVTPDVFYKELKAPTQDTLQRFQSLQQHATDNKCHKDKKETYTVDLSTVKDTLDKSHRDEPSTPVTTNVAPSPAPASAPASAPPVTSDPSSAQSAPTPNNPSGNTTASNEEVLRSISAALNTLVISQNAIVALLSQQTQQTHSPMSQPAMSVQNQQPQQTQGTTQTTAPGTAQTPGRVPRAAHAPAEFLNHMSGQSG